MTIVILSIIYVVVTLVDSVHILTIELNQIAIINCRILNVSILSLPPIHFSRIRRLTLFPRPVPVFLEG
jgi:hypothetical protein